MPNNIRITYPHQFKTISFLLEVESSQLSYLCAKFISIFMCFFTLLKFPETAKNKS